AAANQKKTEEIAVEQSQDQEPPMPGKAQVSAEKVAPQVRAKERQIMSNGRFDRAHHQVRSQPNVFVEDRKGRMVLALGEDGAQCRGPIVGANLAWVPEQDEDESSMAAVEANQRNWFIAHAVDLRAGNALGRRRRHRAQAQTHRLN